MKCKRMCQVIAALPSDVYEEFCTWLRECCGMTISELIELSARRQVDAFFQFYFETRGSDVL